MDGQLLGESRISRSSIQRTLNICSAPKKKSKMAPKVNGERRSIMIRRLVILAAISSLAACSQQDTQIEEEARYLGQTASQWVDQLGNSQDRDEAFDALTRGERESLPVLVELLQHRDWNVRSCAVLGLNEMKGDAKPALPDLIKAAGDEYLTVRYSAMGAIGNIGPEAKEAVPVLIENLEAYDRTMPDLKGPSRYYGDVRAAAAMALGKIGSEAGQAIPDLEKLKREDPSIESEVDTALKAIRAP